ncbi:hypothetical protein VB620_03440 [Nodularia harveyana UHCC-0300]|uniref:Uncharacterized protein n=1 Tax=Nodularia harveyana UHCC-0300 TaxID=2974287 RepID=A0ABU5UAH5_9CYAN|nr:hypothetical protein [Nodularia harveyana]MEA5580393.1 hypothetical protein [Nodularia harveyana UHCC-0300]
MTQQPTSGLVSQDSKPSQITKVAPKTPPVLIEKWVVWELKTCIYTNGNKLSTDDLHDILKSEIEKQKAPIEILFTKDASWLIQGARNKIKEDDDRRPRVVATLKNSIYTDIQFIAGIDYFGGSDWADLQMMIIVQPEEIPHVKKPTKPSPLNVNPLIPNEALAVLGTLAVLIFFFGGDAGKGFGLLGGIGAIVMYIQSNANVKQAQDKYALQMNQYEADLSNYTYEKEKIALEQEERIKNRLSRSFKTDDLRVFHAVMVELVAQVVKLYFIDKGAKVKETVENNETEKNIAAKKNIFDNF